MASSKDKPDVKLAMSQLQQLRVTQTAIHEAKVSRAGAATRVEKKYWKAVINSLKARQRQERRDYRIAGGAGTVMDGPLKLGRQVLKAGVAKWKF